MLGTTIVVLTAHRQTRRQVSRSLGAGGITVQFVELPDEIQSLPTRPAPDAPSLLILDCDNSTTQSIEAAIELLNQSTSPPPVVLLSLSSDKGALLQLIQRHEIGNLVAKHGAIRAVFPVLDERELLVTCEKVLRRNIFGIDKYVGSWGVVLHHALVTSVADKVPCLTRFEQYLGSLDCPPSVIPAIVTVAEELILNAVVHAPRRADGTPKYEDLGPVPDLSLEPHEYVQVAYGCDGQRLMLSVSDNFGGLDRKTLYNYLSRGFDSNLMEAELKPSGAGLGLSLSFRTIHQLIFNIQDRVRTEVIAGWYLRVASASEFRQVGKSLNVFWLPKENRPVVEGPPETASHAMPVALAGKIDESTDFAAASNSSVLDLRGVNAITSRGLLRWLRFISSVAGKRIELRGCPEALVRVAVEVAGVIQGVVVRTVLVPFECETCNREQYFERHLHEVFLSTDEPCSDCGGSLRFSGIAEQYHSFVQAVAAAG